MVDQLLVSFIKLGVTKLSHLIVIGMQRTNQPPLADIASKHVTPRCNSSFRHAAYESASALRISNESR